MKFLFRVLILATPFWVGILAVAAVSGFGSPKPRPKGISTEQIQAAIDDLNNLRSDFKELRAVTADIRNEAQELTAITLDLRKVVHDQITPLAPLPAPWRKGDQRFSFSENLWLQWNGSKWVAVELDQEPKTLP